MARKCYRANKPGKPAEVRQASRGEAPWPAARAVAVLPNGQLKLKLMAMDDMLRFVAANPNTGFLLPGPKGVVHEAGYTVEAHYTVTSVEGEGASAQQIIEVDALRDPERAAFFRYRAPAGGIEPIYSRISTQGHVFGWLLRIWGRSMRARYLAQITQAGAIA